MGSGNSKNKGKGAAPAAAAPAATPNGGGGSPSGHVEESSSFMDSPSTGSPMLFASTTGQQAVATMKGGGGVKSKRWQASTSPGGKRSSEGKKLGSMDARKDGDADRSGGHHLRARGSIAAGLDPNLNQLDNAVLVLQDYIKEKAESLSVRERARLDFVLNSIREVENPESNAMDLSDEDEEIAEWLRADFMQTRVRKNMDLKNRMKTVGLGVLAGKNLLRLTKQGPTVLPDLPFECTDLAEEQAILMSLQGATSWEWNIFKLREASGGRELQVLGWHCLCRWELPQKFNINPETLRRWLDFVEDSYTDTEYHNCTHAADVLHGVFFMLTTCKVEKFLSEIEILALLLSVMVHDLGHDGFNNAFHKHALTDRAIAHNDQSIQENFHAQTVFATMKEYDEINILSAFNAEQQAEIRRVIIQVVLSTDMSKHFVFLKDFTALIAQKGQKPEDWTDSTDQIMAAVMHICDISNPARPREFAVLWAERCLSEFFKQGAKEKELGLPISPQCNEETTSLPQSQIGFIKFIVMPSYSMLGTLLPEVQSIVVKQLEENLEYWQSVAAREKTLLEESKAKGHLLAKGSLRNVLMLRPDGSRSSVAANDAIPIKRKGSSIKLVGNSSFGGSFGSSKNLARPPTVPEGEEGSGEGNPAPGAAQNPAVGAPAEGVNVDGEPPVDLDVDTEELTKAATLIQSSFRGAQVRKKSSRNSPALAAVAAGAGSREQEGAMPAVEEG
uniref:Phosphodiesterase n=1 Tax=Hemiselmis tepida TaxID=464990 RepID=A0A7S0VYN7_9CRYP|mmetsp:Transcript_33262/g.85262  ORF Transcript_33262/g.85262 Transcript_33262/m.85262 type:complete len:730 (+) Transcript_33262:206-2395(+)